MKQLKLIALFSACVFFAASCEKDTDVDEAPYNFPNVSQSKLKINYASAYATNPAVQLSIDDQRVSSLITGRTPFPGGGFNTNGSSHGSYLLVEPGQRKLSISIPKKNTNIDSIVLYTTTLVLEANKYYTAHVSDTFTRTKTLLVEDNLKEYPANGLNYRFVNLMPNVPSLDLYFGATRVATGVLYNTPGVLFTMPAVASQTWSIRETGSSTVLASYGSSNTVLNRRTYTAFAMGYKGTSLPANTRAYISFLLNQ